MVARVLFFDIMPQHEKKENKFRIYDDFFNQNEYNSEFIFPITF